MPEYEIVVGGRVGGRLLSSVEGLEVIAVEQEVTRFRCVVPDQPALHVHLTRLRDLGVQVIGVRKLDTPA